MFVVNGRSIRAEDMWFALMCDEETLGLLSEPQNEQFTS